MEGSSDLSGDAPSLEYTAFDAFDKVEDKSKNILRAIYENLGNLGYIKASAVKRVSQESTPTVKYHLKILEDAQFIERDVNDIYVTPFGEMLLDGEEDVFKRPEELDEPEETQPKKEIAKKPSYLDEALHSEPLRPKKKYKPTALEVSLEEFKNATNIVKRHLKDNDYMRALDDLFINMGEAMVEVQRTSRYNTELLLRHMGATRKSFESQTGKHKELILTSMAVLESKTVLATRTVKTEYEKRCKKQGIIPVDGAYFGNLIKQLQADGVVKTKKMSYKRMGLSGRGVATRYDPTDKGEKILEEIREKEE